MRSFRLQLVTFAALLLLLGNAVSAAAFWAPKHKRDTRAEVLAVDKQWRDALLGGDVSLMDKLLSEDYLGISGNGMMLTKLQQLDRVRNRQLQFERLEITDQKVKLSGSSTAILTSQAEIEGAIDGRKVHGVYRSMRVYQRLPNGTWKMTNFEATPMRRQHPDHDPQS